ncbi:MAG: histidine phosphatase family protein [Actinobacteria bacterium]|nr:histidine phosphatase family protein [Actinomycetota bacterium]
MVARQIHLVRHGEVFNPGRVLYGRIPGFGLSDLGARMATLAASDLAARDRTYSRIIASPLQRTRESAEPVSLALGLAVDIDERIIEPTNEFEGNQMRGRDSAVLKPRNWKYLLNPFRPSWGEPYRSIVNRMMTAIVEAGESVSDGDVVLVSHQLPIWMVNRHLSRKSLAHFPGSRECSLSSITTLEWLDPANPSAGLHVVGYVEPANELLEGSLDVGAV